MNFESAEQLPTPEDGTEKLDAFFANLARTDGALEDFLTSDEFRRYDGGVDRIPSEEVTEARKHLTAAGDIIKKYFDSVNGWRQ